MMAKLGKALLRAVTGALSVLLLLVLFGTSAFAAEDNVTVDVSDAEGFVAALDDHATYSLEDGVCTITLTDDVALGTSFRITAGSYVIKGSHTIARSGNFSNAMFDVRAGASVEFTDSVVLDGGAVWTKDGVPTDSAVGATNEGIVASMSMVDVHEGTLKISGSATVRNNDGYAAIYGDGGHIEVSGGTICANSTASNSTSYGSAVHGYGASTITITGGTFCGNAGPAAVKGNDPAVTSGTFSGNTGAIWGTSSVKLSGSPSFATDDDWVGTSVQLTGALSDKSVIVPLNPMTNELGAQVLSGDKQLVEDSVGNFRLVGTDADLIINSEGKLNTATTSLITNGDELAAALGAGVATSSYNDETGAYTITLSGDCARTRRLVINSGSYVITGAGTISRGDGYAGVLLELKRGTEVKLAGNVVIDGGAKWTIDGAPVNTAVGAKNEGLVAEMSLVDIHGGSFVVAGSAVLRNNDSLAAIYCDDGRVEVSGGSISANSTASRSEEYGSAIHCSGSSAKALISGGSLSGNVGPAAVLGQSIVIEGGTFSGNTGAVRCTSSATGIEISGSPEFATETDWVSPTVQIVGALGKSITVPLDAGYREIGDQVLFGDASLVEGHAECFKLVGACAGMVINGEGRIDAPESGMVSDGKALVEKLGGDGVAASTQDPTTGTYTVTLSGDCSCSQPIYLKSGSFVLAGAGTISRAGGKKGSLIRVAEGASLEIGGSVVLDGGAIWEKDGVKVDTAVGSVNKGATAEGPLVDCAGTFTLSGSAELRNNDRSGSDGGAVDATGPIFIKGGRIYANAARTGAAAHFNSSFDMSGGEVSGNNCTLATGSIAVIHGWDYQASDVRVSGGKVHDNDTKHSAIMARTVTISGGEFSNCQDGVIWWGDNCRAVSISGGTFSGNSRAYGCDETYPKTFELSGAPVFVTETDTLNGPARLTGELTGDSPIRIRLAKYDLGTMIAEGTDGYDLTASDAAKIVLGSNAPAGTYTHFDPDANRVVISSKPDDPCASGHMMEDLVVAATLDRDGYHYQRCSVCGTEVIGDAISRPRTFTLQGKSHIYNGTAQKPSVLVLDASGKAIGAAHFNVEYANNKDAGVARVKITFDGRLYAGTKNLTFTIMKAANPMKARNKAVTVKYASLAKKAQVITAKKAFAVTKAQGKVTFKKVKGNAKIKVSRAGRVTVKKGLKQGTYRLKVKVIAAGNTNYGKLTKTVTFKVLVK